MIVRQLTDGPYRRSDDGIMIATPELPSKRRDLLRWRAARLERLKYVRNPSPRQTARAEWLRCHLDLT